MVSLAIWVAAALFLAFVGFIVLAFLAGVLDRIGNATIRAFAEAFANARAGPFFTRDPRRVFGIAVGLVLLALLGIVVFSAAH